MQCIRHVDNFELAIDTAFCRPKPHPYVQDLSFLASIGIQGTMCPEVSFFVNKTVTNFIC